MEIADFPAFVRALRKKLDLTQEQLGERIGVSFATINRWEAGDTKPQRGPLADLMTLANAAGLEPTYQQDAVAQTSMTDNKPLEKWTWDDLLSYACWEIIAGLTKGESLRSVMYRVLTIATQWKPPPMEKAPAAAANTGSASTKTPKAARKHG